MKTCEACDKPATQNRLRFCSETCRGWARTHQGEKRPVSRTCLGCSIDIVHMRLSATYCSQACGQRHRDAEAIRLRRQVTRICVQCGVSFTPNRANSTCCSVRHYRTWFQKQRQARQRAAGFIEFTPEQLLARLSMFAGCWMCGGVAEQVDHVKPLVAGGWHILSNLRPACGSCNARKGGRWPLAA